MPILFMFVMLVANLIVTAMNDVALSTWWLMCVACGVIIQIAVLRRRYSEAAKTHNAHIREVKLELAKGILRARFKRILKRYEWSEEGLEGIAALSLANAYLDEIAIYENA